MDHDRRGTTAWLLAALLLGTLALALPAQAGHQGGSGLLALGGLDGLRLGTTPLLGGQETSSSGLDGLASPTPSSTSAQPPASEPSAGSQGSGGDEALAPHARGTTGPPAGDEEGAGWMAWLWALPLTVLGLGSVLVARTHRRETGKTPEAAEPAPQAPASGPVGASREADPVPGIPPAPGISGILQLGRQAVDAGAYEDGITWFETAIAVQPRLPVAHFCLGLCLYEKGRYEEAEEAFGHAAGLEPSNPAATFNRARALCQLDRFEEALDHLLPVLQAYPGMAERVHEDPAFRGLRDHPGYLARLGMC